MAAYLSKWRAIGFGIGVLLLILLAVAQLFKRDLIRLQFHGGYGFTEEYSVARGATVPVGPGQKLLVYATGSDVLPIEVALGATGARQWFEPIQPLLAVASIVLLAWALRARLRSERRNRQKIKNVIPATAKSSTIHGSTSATIANTPDVTSSTVLTTGFATPAVVAVRTGREVALTP